MYTVNIAKIQTGHIVQSEKSRPDKNDIQTGQKVQSRPDKLSAKESIEKNHMKGSERARGGFDRLVADNRAAIDAFLAGVDD